MGYRSQVVLALDAKVVPALMTIFAKCESTRKLCTTECDHLDTDYNGEGNWLMTWEHIKWYDSYPEIASIKSLIEALECEDLSDFGLKEIEGHEDGGYGELFSFARIGDDHEDIETSGWGFENVYVTRSVTY